MARQRWATFSVADHKDLPNLIPDILTFDKLIFPYPRDRNERSNWEKADWRPDLLDSLLKDLGDLALPISWGDPERELYRSQTAAVENRQNLEIAAPAYSADYMDRWEVAKQATRLTLELIIKYEYGDDCWLLPRYGSLAALQAERALDIPKKDQERRRTRLSVLLGHEFALPSSARAHTAYTLAIERAKDSTFQRARRALNREQEFSVLQNQSAKDDAQAFTDLVSEFNEQVEKQDKAARRGWVFTLLRGGKELMEIIEKPLSSIFGAAIEVVEKATEGEDIPAGPVAVFHHAKKYVFDPARA
jgi:hypothetical protein